MVGVLVVVAIVRVVVVGATAGISGGVFASFFASPSTTAASVDVKLFVGGSNTVSGGGAAVSIGARCRPWAC